MMKVFLVLCLVLAVFAKKPCEIPMKMQTSLRSVELKGDCLANVVVATEYFDSRNKEIRSDFAGRINGQHLEATTYLYYNKQMGYIVIHPSEICHSFNLTTPYVHPSLNNATYLGEVKIGDEVEDNWFIDTSAMNGRHHVATITAESCLPLSHVTLNATTHAEMEVLSFWNVLPAVPDNIFAFPQQCSQSKRSIEVPTYLGAWRQF